MHADGHVSVKMSTASVHWAITSTSAPWIIHPSLKCIMSNHSQECVLGYSIFFPPPSKTQGSLGVISGKFCMINHALEEERKKKNPIYFLCIEDSRWKRSKGTDKEMRESTSSRLHLAPYERKKITLKLLPWWKKKALWLMYSSSGGINSMNDWKAGRGEVKKRPFCLREPFFFYFWGIRVLFDSSEQNSDSLVRRCDWFNTQRWIISGVCIEKDSRCHQIARSFAVSSLGILLDRAPAKCESETPIWCHILPQPSWQVRNRSWKQNSLQTFH